VGESLLRVEHIDVYYGDFHALWDVSLEVEEALVVSIIGANGAGKSTLLATIAGARPVDAGAVRLAGRDVRTLRADALARERALLTDRWVDPFTCSALDTVLTARYVFRDEVCAEATARRWLASLDCEALADRDVRRLSRGERQRVGIATALAQETPLVLLDEPTAHQDPRHQALVISELAALSGRAQVASLHDLNAAARFATHALMLWGDGRTLGGPTEDVLTPAVLSDLFGTPISRIETNGEAFFHVHRHAA